MADNIFHRAGVFDYPEEPTRAEVAAAFRAFLAHACPAGIVRRAEDTHGVDAALWAAFTDLGGVGASLPESAGGGGGSLHDARVIGAECGRRIAPIPYVEAVAAARLLCRLGQDAAAVGELPWLVVQADDRSDPVLTGTGACTRRALILEAQAAIGAELPPRSVVPVANLGALPMAYLRLDDAVELFRVPLTHAAREAWVCERRVLAASALVGAGTEALAMAVEHIGMRHQFGRSLGSFQVLQHRLADRATQLNAAHLLTVSACDALAENGHGGRYRSAVALMSAVQAGELAAKEAMQMFGGYGYTLEYDVHLYLRYVKATAVLAKDPEVISDSFAPRLRAPAEKGGES